MAGFKDKKTENENTRTNLLGVKRAKNEITAQDHNMNEWPGGT